MTTRASPQRWGKDLKSPDLFGHNKVTAEHHEAVICLIPTSVRRGWFNARLDARLDDRRAIDPVRRGVVRLDVDERGAVKPVERVDADFACRDVDAEEPRDTEADGIRPRWRTERKASNGAREVRRLQGDERPVGTGSALGSQICCTLCPAAISIRSGVARLVHTDAKAAMSA